MSNLLLRGSTFYFRKVLPKDVRSYFQKRELTLSLRTQSKRKARRLSVVLLGVIETSFAELRSKTHLSDKQAVCSRLLIYLSDFTKEEDRAENRQPLASQELNPALIKTEYAQDTLKSLYQTYINEKLKMDWKKSTKQGGDAAFNCLVEIFGDIEPRKITKAMAVQFMQELYCYPSKRSQGANKGLSLKELKDKGVPPIAPTTAMNLSRHLSIFFNWLESREYIPTNPFKGVTPRAGKTSRKTKAAFTEEDLHKLFCCKFLREKNSDKSWRYWIPVLALYTGARVEEIAQLNVADVKQGEGFLYLAVHDEGTNQLKNRASIRKIPLHGDMADIGFNQYLEARQAKEKLFELPLNKGFYGKNVTAWFSYYKRGLGFGPSKVFHSFRHTFRDLAVESGVPSEHIKAILGHAQGDMTHGIYGSGFSLKLLNESMQRVDFGFVKGLLV